MTEAEFQSAVIELAKLTGWKWYHTHNSRRSVPGFPDLVLVHRVTGRVVFAELKTETGRVAPAQTEWLDLLGVRNDAYLWRPNDLDGEIRDVLTAEVKAA